MPAVPACPTAPLTFCLQVLEYIEGSMPPESAAAFGLHPNSEIGLKLREASAVCSNLQTLQVSGWVGGPAGGRRGCRQESRPHVRASY
jgi:hypothetical protein